jgi:hypothetical protein
MVTEKVLAAGEAQMAATTAAMRGSKRHVVPGKALNVDACARVLMSFGEVRAIEERPDMTSLIPESIFSWVSRISTLMPLRDPNDDDDEEEEKEDDHEADDDREPAVIREPDKDD